MGLARFLGFRPKLVQLKDQRNMNEDWLPGDLAVCSKARAVAA